MVVTFKVFGEQLVGQYRHFRLEPLILDKISSGKLSKKKMPTKKTILIPSDTPITPLLMIVRMTVLETS